MDCENWCTVSLQNQKPNLPPDPDLGLGQGLPHRARVLDQDAALCRGIISLANLSPI